METACFTVAKDDGRYANPPGAISIESNKVVRGYFSANTGSSFTCRITFQHAQMKFCTLPIDGISAKSFHQLSKDGGRNDNPLWSAIQLSRMM